MKRLLKAIPILLLIVSTLPRCAKIVAPTGGLKDTIPPVLVRSNPEINSKNFKGDKLVLTFDEYIMLKDIQKKLVVSPPMIKKPEVSLKGRSVEVKLREPLKDETTYSFYFSDAIGDNNEGNPIKNFDLSFSTGSSIDSLSISGVITNAFTLLPEEGAIVMLYENQSDSVPYKELPVHIAQSNKEGIFTLKNLKNRDYKVVAIKDANSNYKLDGTSEDIAYTDSILKKDLLKGPSKADTSMFSKKDINLVMFREKNRTQALTNFSRDQRKRISISFSKKPEGEITLTPLNVDANKEWYLKEIDPKEDSLIYWITDDRVSAIDSLKIKISYFKTDSLEQLQQKIDTLRFTYEDKETPRSRRKDKNKDEAEETKKVYLTLKSNVISGQVAKPTKPFELTFPSPLLFFNDSLLSLVNLKDSSIIKGIKYENDSINKRIYRFSYAWASDETYEFKAMPGAFKSIDGLENDTLIIKFKGANPENFGNLFISLKNVNKAAIVELLDEKGAHVIEQRYAQADEKLSFTFLDPAKYTIRFIEDLNRNKKWDTGWYLKKIQPERVFKFVEGKTKGVINVRANWDNDISYDFSK